MLSRLLYVSPDLLRRGWPFFALYFMLFAALTLADSLSLTLFIQRVGVASLPAFQAISALCIMAAVCGYVARVDRAGPAAMFLAILVLPIVLLTLVWVVLRWCDFGESWLGLLFIGRELAFALVLLHFGTFLQDYFSRQELNRVMPLIYAGGRVGGIVAGAALEHFSGQVAPLEILPATVLIFIGSAAGIIWIRRRYAAIEKPATAVAAVEESPASAEEIEATGSIRGFGRFVVHNSLMFWITLTTIAYFCCRTFLCFRYNQCFENTFTSEAEMARFLGAYTKYALTASLLLQLFFVNRWIALVGLQGAHLTYAALLLMASLSAGLEMTLAAAVFARLVENELRFGLRNPANQMTVNLFSKALRIRARAWSLGLLIPLSTLLASLALGLLLHGNLAAAVGLLTALTGIGYLAIVLRLTRQIAAVQNDQQREETSSSVLFPNSLLKKAA